MALQCSVLTVYCPCLFTNKISLELQFVVSICFVLFFKICESKLGGGGGGAAYTWTFMV